MSATDHSTAHDANESQEAPFLTIHDQYVYFREDWATGIGGGLWSTGLAMGRYFQTDHSLQAIQNLAMGRKLTVLELGSGNGFLAVCLLALAKELISDLVITDTADHLDLIRSTLSANSHLLGSCHVHVVEHNWGEFDAGENGPDDEDTWQSRLNRGQCKFDLILGSELAYHKRLYDPLIASLSAFCDMQTVALMGVNMADTTRSFFRKLDGAGFTYRRLADHLMEPEFRGTMFGIFVVQRYRL